MNNKLEAFLLFLFTLLISHHVLAQHTIKGTVTDAATGNSLPGVTIIEEGTSNGTTTNGIGEYTIEVGNDAVLIFRFIGYKTVKRKTGGHAGIDVALENNAQKIHELVVTALGFKENSDKLGYATSVIDGEDIAKSTETTLLNSLSGKASGLRISRNSGDPGAGAYIQIRGISTITRNAQPLIVIDGVPVSNDVRGNGDGRIAQQSRLNDINPNDIAGITVLKGASAAALWGTQALGGAIMITTKSGRYNQKLKISFQSGYSFDQISRKYPLQTKFGRGNNGVFVPRARDSWGDKISERAGGADEINTSGEYFIDQNGKVWYPIVTKNAKQIFDESNFDQIFQNGHAWNNNISLSAGDEKSKGYLSISDLNQEGIIRNNSDYRRTTLRFNGEHKFAEKLKVSASLFYSKTNQNRIRRGASSSGLYLGLLRTPPDFDNSGYRGNYYSATDASPISNRQRSYREPLGADASASYNNPLWTIHEEENLAVVNRFINTLNLTYSPTDWIDLIGRVGIDHYSERKQQFNTPGAASGAYLEGLYSPELAVHSIFNMDYIAKATKSFNKNLNGSLLVGFNYNAKKTIVSGAEISNFIQFTDVAGGTRDIDNALPENRNVENTFGQERTAALYSSFTLSAYNMLFINGTIRAETASTFGDQADNTFIFPSVSVAWQFNELLSYKPLSFGKLRFSYGEVGVQPARYNTSNIFVSPAYSDAYGGNLDMGLYGNGGFVPSTSRGNPGLKPERKKEFEIGADLRLLKDRLSFSGTYYHNVTEDVLLNLPIANSRGYDKVYANGGEIRNKGLEFDLGYHLIDKKDWGWQLHLIYSEVKNEVTDLAGVNSIGLGGLDAVNSRAVEGHPLGVLWGSRILRDENGKIIFDENGFPEQDEREGIIGDPNPDWQGSVSTGLSYKNISLSALLTTFRGADIYAGTKAVLYSLGRWKASATETTAQQNLLDFNGNVIAKGTTFRGIVRDFGAGPVALTEAWYTNDGGYFSGGNDELYIEDGSWTRLKELRLSYRLDNPWLNSIGIGSAELSVTARNLFIWTPFEGNDPNTSLAGVSIARGVEYFNNPGIKSYVFTLHLNF